jgi:hypothetical protein
MGGAALVQISDFAWLGLDVSGTHECRTACAQASLCYPATGGKNAIVRGALACGAYSCNGEPHSQPQWCDDDAALDF